MSLVLPGRYNFSKFAMSLQSGDGTEGYDEACHATVHTPGRQEDYLLIPQSILSRNAAYQPTYYCGTNDNLVVFGKSPVFSVAFFEPFSSYPFATSCTSSASLAPLHDALRQRRDDTRCHTGDWLQLDLSPAHNDSLS